MNTKFYDVSGHHSGASADAADIEHTVDLQIAKRQGEGPMRDAALEYAQRGWWVFPAPPGQKKSYKSEEHSGAKWGKTTDPEEIRRDFRKWPDANVAIVTGAASGIFVLEADTIDGHGVDGLASIRALETEHGPLPETLMAVSPSGSVHRYFKHPSAGLKVWSRSGKIAPGVDVKGDGGMVIAPPSVKPGAGRYRWLNDLPIADPPAWLIERVTDENKAKKQTARSSVGGQARTLDPFEVYDAGHSRADVNLDEIEAALMVIPNHAGVIWEEWNRIAMALFDATGSSHAGFELFDRWSQKYPGYNADDTAAKWEVLKGCPPTEIGVGTIFYLADQASPTWRADYRLSSIRADAIRIDKPDKLDLIEQAIDLFDIAQPLRGTPAEKYLRSLGLTVPDTAHEVLRFHPSCPFGDRNLPCLIAYVQDGLTNEPAGAHLTALSPDAIVLGLPGALGCKTIGSIDCYSVIKLGGDPHAFGELTIAATIEAALAAMMLGFGSAWSVLSVQGIAEFPKPRFHNIKRLSVIVDSNEAVEAAAKCKARWGSVVRVAPVAWQ